MTLAWIIQLIITCVVGIIAYFLKDMKKTHEDKISQLDNKVSAVEKKADQNKDELNDYKVEASREYAKKEDYLRTNGEIMKRLDKIQDLIIEMMRKGSGQ